MSERREPGSPASGELADELVVRGGIPLRGRLRVPGDKSISHRALLLAAMAHGQSRLTGLADGDDVGRTLAALEALGVGMRRDGRSLVITGAGPDALREPSDVLDCANSGTTLRMLAGLTAGRPFHTVLTGDASLRRRPMRRVVDPLRAMGATIDGRDEGEHPPLAIRGGDLRGGEHRLRVASAQVKTALLLAGLQATGRTTVIEPHRSRDHSERLLGALGAPIERVDETTVAVRAGKLEPFVLEVPADPSSAAFFAVAAAIVPDSELVLEDVLVNPTRLGYVEVLTRMGADVAVNATGSRLGEQVGELRVKWAPLHGTTVTGDEVATVIDELPVLAVAAAVADGPTEVRGAAELRLKETDRIAAITQELEQLGAAVEPRADGFVVAGSARLAAGILKGHGDHRIALAGAIAALGADGESTIRGWSSVSVSYPGFGSDLAALRPAENSG